MILSGFYQREACEGPHFGTRTNRANVQVCREISFSFVANELRRPPLRKQLEASSGARGWVEEAVEVEAAVLSGNYCCSQWVRSRS